MKLSKNCIIFSCLFVLLLTSFWIFITYDVWVVGSFRHKLKGIGAFIGVLGYCLFSLSLFLSARLKKFEDWFGGLDKIYHAHHKIGMYGFSLLLIHPFILAARWLPYHFDKFLLFFLPIHRRLSVNLGSYGFWFMIIIIGITILKILPYDKWKISHKFMSLVYFLASFHFLFSDRIFGPSISTKLLLLIPMSLGLFGIIYNQIIRAFFAKYPIYEVVDLKKLNLNTMEIYLKPKDEVLSFSLGQYAFFRFQGASITDESHPFTMCPYAEEAKISILVKARGDFTKSLYQNLKSGCLAHIEGPYGQFNYLKGKSSQVWIAGGIGIVPYLTWVRELSKSSNKVKNVDLFYCVHNEKDAVYLEEFRKISDQFPTFGFFFFSSENNERLTAKKVKEIKGNLFESSIFICGPKKMTSDLTRQFSQLGIEEKNIIFEDFEFF